MDAPQVELSLIVPAFNEERLIGRTLDALLEVVDGLDVEGEILVVDDASTDGTAGIARDRGVQVVEAAHRQIAATRNAGARRAKGRFFVFVDADTVAGSDVVNAALAAMHGGAVGGGAAVRFDGPLPRWASWVLPPLMALYRAARLAPGCCIFATREAFEAVGGFDERYFGAEEIELSRALRKQGRFVLLRESVVSSGRKLRAHSGREILGLAVRLFLRGRKGVQRREGMELWYGERRPDPHAMDSADGSGAETGRRPASGPPS